MRHHVDVLVIGGGAAGRAAALAAGRRKSVALIDAAGTGGRNDLEAGMLKAFARAASSGSDYATATKQAKDWADEFKDQKPHKRALQAVGVAVFTGRAEFSGSNQIQVGHDHFSARSFVVATGSSPTKLEVTGGEQTSDLADVWSAQHQPQRVVLIGPDFLQLAKAFEALGSTVTLIKPDDLIISSLEKLQRSVRLNWLDHAKPVSLTAELVVADHQTANLDLNLAAAAVKSQADGILIDKHSRTTNPRIWAVGGCLVPEQCRYSPATQGSIVGAALARHWF